MTSFGTPALISSALVKAKTGIAINFINEVLWRLSCVTRNQGLVPTTLDDSGVIGRQHCPKWVKSLGSKAIDRRSWGGCGASAANHRPCLDGIHVLRPYKEWGLPTEGFEPPTYGLQIENSISVLDQRQRAKTANDCFD
jgi:hypothetical protein